MPFFQRHPTPWGYLLPLRGDLPLLELCREGAGVYLDQHHVPRCDTADPPTSAGSTGLFTVRREAQTGSVHLRSHSPLMRVDGEAVPCEKDVGLRHGQSVSFGRGDSAYVYVNSTESESILTPELNKQYVVGKCVGSGGFGKVYLLFEKVINDQLRALKIIQLRSKKKQLNYVQGKGEILTTLKHPCLISVYCNVQLNFKRFLVLEYIAGGDLKQLLNNKYRLTEVQSKLIFFQLALAVQYLHDRNVCHFNLKPENILLERSDPHTLIKITDFGLVKDRAGIATLKTIAGSIPFLAPEIIKEENCWSNSADVWSMGVLLFFILTGALPFKNLEEAALHRHAVDFAQAQWGGVSGQAYQLLQAMLKVKSTSRPSAQQVVECSWLRDEAMRKEASELTGLKGIECKTAKPNHRHVYIGMPDVLGNAEWDYIYLEGGSSPRLGQRCHTLVRRWARTLGVFFLFTVMFVAYTVFK